MPCAPFFLDYCRRVGYNIAKTLPAAGVRDETGKARNRTAA